MLSDDANPLHGWDVSAVQTSGIKHGLETADIFGCMFFHVKDQLREFAKRMQSFDIDIHVTQFDTQVLSKGIASGLVPAFDGCYFDRVMTSDMMDYVGIQECLKDWAPLLNTHNKHACILMHTKFWHINRPNASARSNPRVVEMFLKKCCQVPGMVLIVLALR